MNGSCEWFIPDCYWPEIPRRPLVSHEAICVLNTCAEDADIELTLYFEDAEPIEGFTAKCPARRTHHIRLDKLTDAAGRHVPMGKPCAVAVKRSVPVLCPVFAAGYYAGGYVAYDDRCRSDRLKCEMPAGQPCHGGAGFSYA